MKSLIIGSATMLLLLLSSLVTTMAAYAQTNNTTALSSQERHQQLVEQYERQQQAQQQPVDATNNDGGVSILSHAQTGSDFGSMYIVGEVRNNLSHMVNYVQIVGSFYDSSGTLIDTGYTYTDPSDLRAGQSAPFEVRTLDESIAEDIESVKLSVQSADYFGVDPELAAPTAQTIN